MNDFRKALELDENFQRAKEGLDRAQKRQKQASKRDYYKILGVKMELKVMTSTPWKAASAKWISPKEKAFSLEWIASIALFFSVQWIFTIIKFLSHF